MSHSFFVAASYGATVLVLGGLMLWIAITQRARKAELTALEDAGIKRRSDGT